MVSEKFNLLVIEDNQMLANTLKDFFELKNFDVNVFYSGEEMLEVFTSLKPDIIVCDIILPGINGIDVFKTIKKIKKDFYVPFIFLSSIQYQNTQMEAKKIGADDYLTKPFNLNELEEIISNTVKKVSFLKGLQQKNKLLKNELSNIKSIINHQIRSSAAKILTLENKANNNELQDSDMQLVFKEANAILKVTDEASAVISDQINSIGRNNSNYPIRIMVVDDDVFLLNVTKVFISKNFPHARIFTFSNPEMALKDYKSVNPDLIILDLYMPQMSGFDFLEKLKLIPVKVNVIVHSSTSNKDEINKAVSYSAVKAFLPKPMQPHEMKKIITQFISNDKKN